ncbi:hypothetical protein ColLi_00707 [Colletotrichum liriopes]|uniref:Uncharacterized protein n=1 Tax=Colletotrichum liriopes TaxID=708192 RepID=A0AA37GBY2_9PEZI|nr:hypothetical protein ColLi_00707 [Colletotrichum liriopes]
MKSENSNSTGRTYDDIDRVLSGTGSDIELNKTAREEGRDEDNDYDGSRPSSDLGQRNHVQETQASHNRPVINVRTTIDIMSHSVDLALPPTECSAGEKEEEKSERGDVGDRRSRVA